MKANTPDNIDELYDSLPENERLIAGILRELILESLPLRLASQHHLGR